MTIVYCPKIIFEGGWYVLPGTPVTVIGEL